MFFVCPSGLFHDLHSCRWWTLHTATIGNIGSFPWWCSTVIPIRALTGAVALQLWLLHRRPASNFTQLETGKLKTCPFWKLWLAKMISVVILLGKLAILRNKTEKMMQTYTKKHQKGWGKKAIHSNNCDSNCKKPVFCRHNHHNHNHTTEMKKRGTPSMHSELNFLQLPNLLW